MSIIRTKRSRSIVIGLVAAVAVAGGAIAFWTSSGTGSGTAQVGTTSGLAISNVTFGNTLVPGISTPVSFRITNLSPTAPVTVAQVVADTAAGTNGITGLPGGCNPADFSFPNYAVNQSIPAGGFINLTAATASGLAFANTSVNQDNCKTATPVLNLRAN